MRKANIGQMARRGELKTQKAQAGVTMLQYLIGAVFGTAATIALVNAVQGQRAEGELNRGLSFIQADLPQALTAYYQTRNRTYANLVVGDWDAATPRTTGANSGTANDNGAQLLVERSGLDPLMPWGPSWGVSVAGDADGVTFQFSCEDMRTETQCEELAAVIDSRSNDSDGTGDNSNPIIASAAYGGDDDDAVTVADFITVVYNRPR